MNYFKYLLKIGWLFSSSLLPFFGYSQPVSIEFDENNPQQFLFHRSRGCIQTLAENISYEDFIRDTEMLSGWKQSNEKVLKILELMDETDRQSTSSSPESRE